MVKKKRGVRKKKNFSLKSEYTQSWNYIRESKRFIYSIIWIFVLFTLIGFLVPAPDFISEKIIEFIKSLLEQTEGMSQFELTQFIFLNNIQSSFLGMAAGIFLGIFPLLTTIANGFVLGFVALESVKAEGILILWRILPHGIFELPALFISLGLGLRLGTFFFYSKHKPFVYYVWNSLRVFIFVVLPLLIIAALIEGGFIFLFR